jgi:Glycosyl transferase family 11
MIVSSIMGGLGNQLFCYAAGYAVSRRRQVPFKLDITHYLENAERSFDLDKFNISAEIATPGDLARCARYSRDKLGNKVLAKLAFWRSYGQTRHFRQRGFAYDEEVLKLGDFAYMQGHFQSEKFFSDVAADIRKEFTLKDPLPPDNQEIARKIQNCESVCLHVRRTDYVNDPRYKDMVAACEIGYYSNAFARLRSIVGATFKLFVFSDEPDWCRQNLRLDGEMEFVSLNGPDKPWLDLYLMSCCRHHIIANSTFSWWGAWLARPDGQIVIAPQRWLVSKTMDYRDVVPERWIKMD